MNLLEDGAPGSLAHGQSHAYWRRALRARGELIRQIYGDLAPERASHEPSNVYPRVHAALSAAHRVHELIYPEGSTRYVGDWQSDMKAWRAYLTWLTAEVSEDTRDAPALLDALMNNAAQERAA